MSNPTKTADEARARAFVARINDYRAEEAALNLAGEFAAVRAETVERCAGVCDAYTEQREPDSRLSLDEEYVAICLAERIRALNPSAERKA